MAWFLFGLAVLGLLIVLGRFFVSADPKTLAKTLRYAAAGLLSVFAVGLALSGRLAIAAMLGAGAWFAATGRLPAWAGGRFGAFSRAGPGSAPRAGQTSGVRTRWVELTLDHETGDITGRVLRGVHAGRAFEDLSFDEVVALRNEASGDAETERLVETYLERNFGADWGERAYGGRRAGTTSRDRMSIDEARNVLGLDAGATPEEVRSAHRRLMMQHHPDRGGSSYLAAQINEAKAVLLGE